MNINKSSHIVRTQMGGKIKNKKQIELIGREFQSRFYGLLFGVLLLFGAINTLIFISNIGHYNICRHDMDDKYNIGCIEPIDYFSQQAGGALIAVIAFCGAVGGTTLIFISLSKLGFNFEK